jgi:glyoxylase-like metal-dependent hydrolase (beta-lactamase superfamily II)
VKDASFFDPSAEKGVEMDVPVTCYLIRHPKGTVMVDAGLPDSIADIKDGVPLMDGALVWLVPRTLQSQLDEIGVDPATIDYLVLSHLHPDHIGNMAYFNNSTMLIQEAEYDSLSASIKEMESIGADTSLYTAVTAHQPVMTLAGNYDVFGDGSVVLVSTPGHSPGHQAVVGDLPDTGPVILGGDLYFSQQDHENYVVSPRTVDKRQLIKSFALIDDLLEQTGAQLWLCHDKEQNDHLAHAPTLHE